jgi:hypothetical protein
MITPTNDRINFSMLLKIEKINKNYHEYDSKQISNFGQRTYTCMIRRRNLLHLI